MQTEKEYSQQRQILRLHSESNGEYPLPDYNTDVKKLLTVKANVIPSGKFLSDGAIEFSGIVNYNIVYLDSDNNITHAEFNTDYDIAVKTDTEKYADSDIDTYVSASNVRLIGPRKFSAKCSLESNIYISESCVMSIDGDAMDGYEAQTLSADASIVCGYYAHGEEREFAEEMLTLEGSIADEVEVLLCDCTVDARSAVRAGDKVEIKGEMKLGVLYKNIDEVKYTERVFPYSECINIEYGDGSENISACVNMLSVRANVNPTDDGVSVVVSVITEPKVRLVNNCPLELIKDAFLMERGSDNTYGDFTYNELVGNTVEDGELSFKAQLPDASLSEGAQILFVSSDAAQCDAQITDGRIKVCGEAKFSAIVCERNGDDELTYYPIKISSQIEKYVNFNCQISGNCSIKCSVSLTNVKMENDNGGVLCSCDMSIDIEATERKVVRCLLGSYLTDEEFAPDDSVITVYYPESGESLFSVAKRFRTSLMSIASDNSLSESVFSSPGASLTAMGTRKLLIKQR